jgi:hypothetical protein
MKQILFAMAMLPMLAAVAQAKPTDWQAKLDRCRAMRAQMEQLLLAGQGLSSPIARSGTAARRCVWIERRALKHGAR